MPQGKISHNNVKVAVVMPKELREKADVLAANDGRSLSNWIRTLIYKTVKDYEDQRGYELKKSPIYFEENEESSDE